MVTSPPHPLVDPQQASCVNTSPYLELVYGDSLVRLVGGLQALVQMVVRLVERSVSLAGELLTVVE